MASLSAVPSAADGARSPGGAELQGSAEQLKALDIYKQPDTSKVIILFQPTGSAPVLKQKYFKITAGNKFQAVITFLRKELGWKPQDSLFLYINAAFSPAPDDTVGNLYKCFKTENYLIVNYSSTAAWG